METAEQHPVEIILARGFITNLTTPAFLVDPSGTLIFFNDAAAGLLGVSYEEAGPMPAAEWGTKFLPINPDGSTMAADELPLSIAVIEARPSHKAFGIRAMDGREHTIEVAAFPVIGREGQSGALAIFWDVPE